MDVLQMDDSIPRDDNNGEYIAQDEDDAMGVEGDDSEPIESEGEV
jgi:hypothetical protein